MEITVSGKSYSFQFGFKSFLLFEGVTGRSFDGTSLTDEITMMLCCIIAGDSRASLVVDDLVVVLDEAPELLTQWRKWFGSHIERQTQRMTLEADSGKKKE